MEEAGQKESIVTKRHQPQAQTTQMCSGMFSFGSVPQTGSISSVCQHTATKHFCDCVTTQASSDYRSFKVKKIIYIYYIYITLHLVSVNCSMLSSISAKALKPFGSHAIACSFFIGFCIHTKSDFISIGGSRDESASSLLGLKLDV